jgi:hypothetical protein
MNYAIDFDPKEYLNEYFLIDPEIEDIFITQFMIKALCNMPQDLLTLEFGAGPVLLGVAILAPQSREIHMCDYLPASMDEIRRWLANKPNAFNWDPYIKMVLSEEGKSTTPKSVTQRATEMRRKVTHLTTCDVLASNPICENNFKYDLVIAQSITEAVADSVSQWMQVMQNISTLIAPSGWLLISVLTDTTGYIVGERNFPCVDLTNEDIYHGYMEAGYDPDTFYLEKITTPGHYGYSSLVGAIARKM